MEGFGLRSLALSAEDAALLRAGTLRLNAGRIIVADEAAFASQLGKIRLLRAPNSNPKLFIQGRSKAFAEVLPSRGKIRLLDYNKEFSIDRNIFSVEGNAVNIRSTASSISNSNIVGQVNKGSMVIKLGEKNGWYQVKLIDKGNISYGYIKGSLLAPLVLLEQSYYPLDSIETKTSSLNLSSNYKSYDGPPITLYHEYLKLTLSSLDIETSTIKVVIQCENISSSGKRLALALKANGSDGLADYWKFFPSALGSITDAYGNEYVLSHTSGMGYAKTAEDWSILNPTESVYLGLTYENYKPIIIPNTFNLNIEIRLAYLDPFNTQQHQSFVANLNYIKM